MSTIKASTRLVSAFPSWKQIREHADKISRGEFTAVKSGSQRAKSGSFVGLWLSGKKHDPLKKILTHILNSCQL